MTCEECQELISVFLDNDLDESRSANVRMHLANCAPCAKVCEDFAMILDAFQLEEAENFVPPNSKALWCRINNIIECETKPEITEEKTEQPPQGWFRNSWRFSFSQVLTSVLGIAVISSLLTIVGVKNYLAPGDSYASSSAPTSVFQKVLGKLGLVETPQEARERRIKEQQAAIDYWNKRVDERRNQWNAHLREAFDRNLNEINQAVLEYNRILEENPQDEVSSEMLDSALNEKMELLREFSDL